MTIELRHGDTETISFADLATAAGATLTNFATGDVVKFTLRREVESVSALVALVSTTVGAITFSNGSIVGSVNIAATDWNATDPVHGTQHRCVWDLQRTRGAAVDTLATGTLVVLPDVTR